MDLVILGGGCGGLWLLHEAASRGYDVVLLEDSDSVGRFATTRGQNKLHSGAMYIAAGQDTPPAFLAACKRGYENLVTFCESSAPSSITAKQESGVYLVKSEAEREAMLARSAALDGSNSISFNRIESTEFSARDLSVIKDWAPEFCFGIESAEYSFNAYTLLESVVKLSKAKGGRIIHLDIPFRDLGIDRSGEAWQIHYRSELLVEAPYLIISCGVLGPTLLSQISGENIVYPIEKTLITVLHRHISNRFIGLQGDPFVDFLAFAPYGPVCSLATGMSGTKITSPDDSEVDTFKDSVVGHTLNALSRCFPNIDNKIQIGVHFYTCQKVQNSNDSSHPAKEYGERHYFWKEAEGNTGLFLYSPGKWTFSPVAAQEFINNLEEHGRLSCSDKKDRHFMSLTGTTKVAVRPVFAKPTHALVKEGNNLSLHEVA